MAGAGGGALSLGLFLAGHVPSVLVEKCKEKRAVLRRLFPGVGDRPGPQIWEDVRDLSEENGAAFLPPGLRLLASGFSCRDVSAANQNRSASGGIFGPNSSMGLDVSGRRPPRREEERRTD